MRDDVMVRAIRVLRLMQQRREYRMTAAQLAKELGVSQRQAFRWLAACRRAGVHVPEPVYHWRDVQ